MIVVVPVVLLAALVGAWVGWLAGTSELQRPSFDPLDPVFPEEDRGDRIYRRRLMLRVALTVFGAIAGAIAGVFFLFWLARH